MKSRDCAGILPGLGWGKRKGEDEVPGAGFQVPGSVRGAGHPAPRTFDRGSGFQNLNPIPTLVERFLVVHSMHGGTPKLRWRITVVPTSNRAMVRGVG